MQSSVLRDKAPPQLLFIERCLQLLKPGGKLGIILPESYLHGPSHRYIVNWLEQNHNIYAVIDLPHNTFRPHCNAKTLAVFIKKDQAPSDSILFAIAEEFGHDHQGKPKYRFDDNAGQPTDDIWDDSVNIISELDDPANVNNQHVFVVPRSSIRDHVYVPKYYAPNYKAPLGIHTGSGMSIGKLEELQVIKIFRGHGSPKSVYKGKGPVPYVRAADIIDWTIYKNPTSGIPVDEYDKLMQKKSPLKVHDVVFVKEGSYRIGDVAILGPMDTEIYLNSHCLVFRVMDTDNEFGITPYYLMYLLSHASTKDQMLSKILTDTTLPNIGNRYKELVLPLEEDEDERLRIEKDVKQVCENRWEAASIMSKLLGKM